MANKAAQKIVRAIITLNKAVTIAVKTKIAVIIMLLKAIAITAKAKIVAMANREIETIARAKTVAMIISVRVVFLLALKVNSPAKQCTVKAVA